MSSKKKSVDAKDVWKRPAPRKTTTKHLSSSQKASAKASAKRAGRPYPNLVDNIRAAKEKKPANKKKQ